MLESFKSPFIAGFIPHGHCYLWKPELVWLHVLSDSLIALAYYSIPLMLVYFVCKRRDIPFDWIFLMFGSFIVACGTTHLMAIWTLWHPTYWLSGFIKAITALVSLSTAVLLIQLIPQALTLPSPAQLEIANLALTNEIIQRKLAEERLHQANEELEIRVKERTNELALINQSLKIEISERKQIELHIQESLQEKEVLLQEIHHRVKNNLQVISSLLDLQSQYVEDKDTREMFRESQNRVKSMSLVHEKLYQSQDYTKVNFTSYIGSLANDLLQAYRVSSENISLKLDIDEVCLSINTAIPCGLIINELISNALKYAFPKNRKGTIKIALYSDEEKHLILSIKDNGVGFPSYWNLKKIETLGLQLVNVLVSQIEGILELNLETGTEFCIRFPECINV